MKIGDVDEKEKKRRVYRNLRDYEVKSAKRKKEVSDQRYVVPWQMFDEEWEKLEHE